MTAEETKTMEPEMPHFECIGKISKLPVVESVWNQTSGLYERVKESSGMANWTLSTAEATVQKVIDQAVPLVKKLEQPINAVDDTLCKGLDVVEEKVPIVKQPPQEIYEAAKTYMNTTFQPAVEKATAVRDYSWGKANEVLATKYGKAAVDTLQSTANVANKYVDYYFPATEDETAEAMPEVAISEDDRVMQSVDTVGKLSNKIRKRVYKAMVLQMKGLKEQSEQTMATLVNTVDILQLAKLNMDPRSLADKVNALWVELNKEGEEAATTLEQRSLVLARRLTRSVVSFFNQVQQNVTVLPSHLKTQMDQAGQYAMDMYETLKGKSFQEISESVVLGVKDQAGKIQSVLTNVNSYVVQWLENFIPEEEGEVIEMETRGPSSMDQNETPVKEIAESPKKEST